MNNRLAGASAQELERQVKLWFEATRELPGATDFFEAPTLEVPVIGGLTFIAGHAPPSLVLQVCRALVAREKFHLEKPPGAPDLPLRWEDIAAMENADDNRLNLLGLFGNSQRHAYWEPSHPSYTDFASGVLADSAAPDYLRNDVSLQKAFPPRPLPGLVDGELVWYSPAALAQHRHMQSLCAAADART
jgi:hypothetical protein